jgi:hypothetical protein
VDRKGTPVLQLAPSTGREELNVKLQNVINANEEQMRRFAENSLVKLVRRPAISEDEKERIVERLQPWSDIFQRVIALRVACESDRSLQALAQQHLAEEVNHNTLLAKTRSGGEDSGFWDPIISAAASWFVDQMLTLPGVERAVLAHLVLEGSGLVVLQAGCTAYPDSEYFALHSEADQEHLEMGYRLLAERVDEWQVDEVLQLLDRGWKMMMLLCERIAYSATQKSGDSSVHQEQIRLAS